MANRIIFTGGGSAGHVTPNLALMALMQQEQWEMAYIGSYQGIERDIVAQQGIPYFAIAAGKLRRYFSWQNFIDPFKTIWGFIQSFVYCYRYRPDVVFSKGGFVAFPVVVAARCLGIPVVAHESDLTPGLANKLSYYFANKILLSFPEGKKYFKDSQKVIFTGTPVRPELLKGNADKGRQICGFNREKPILLVIGGGLGAKCLNDIIENNLAVLLKHYQIMHICGQQASHDYSPQPGYYRFGYVHEPLADLFAAADIVLSRAGANALWELLALNKPHVLVPLSKKASRGDQIINAEYFKSIGVSHVIQEENLNIDVLSQELAEINSNVIKIKENMQSQNFANAVNKVRDEIVSTINPGKVE